MGRGGHRTGGERGRRKMNKAKGLISESYMYVISMFMWSLAFIKLTATNHKRMSGINTVDSPLSEIIGGQFSVKFFFYSAFFWGFFSE